jgi:hypothetical protein
MSEDTPEYTTHNFSAVDKQILEIAKREKARTFAYQLKSIRMVFLYGLAIFLMAALLILTISWSYRILNEPYVSEVVKVVRPEIIEKEVLKIIEVPVSEDAYSNFPSTVVESSDNSSDGITRSNMVTNYNIFRTIETPEFEKLGIREVTTGWTYSSSEQDFPESQYCYVLKFDEGNTAPFRISLAERSEGVTVSGLTEKVARETKVSVSALENLLSYCSWAKD